jgi:hypothetical protein
MNTARVQREAVAAIERSQGSVLYDWEFKDGQAVAAPRFWAPGWLVQAIGVDCLAHVVDVSLIDARPSWPEISTARMEISS